MAANIGEADVEIHGDLKPFEKDLAKARAILESLGDKKVHIEADFDDKKVVRFNSVVGQALGKASQLSKVKFDNLNELAGSALAADSLLNVLGNIFNSALKVRRVAVQMGAALAAAFAGGAQAAGAFISALGRVVSGLEAAAGIGVLAIGIKLQLANADVAEAKNNLTSTFKEVGTRASESLREPLKTFFNDLASTTKTLEPTFTKFFATVKPGFEALGKSINKTLLSPQFQELFNRIGASANKFLEGTAARLPGILNGFLVISGAIKTAGARIREAFGPGILDKFNVTGFVNGIKSVTDALVSAGPGVKAFKANLGLAFDAVGQAAKGVLATIGQVGPALFNALGPIAAKAATAAGTIASSFIKLAAEVFPAVTKSAQQFITVFGDNFAKSIEGLAAPLSAVINGAAQLGTSLAPLLPIFSQILTNLDPIVVGFLSMLNAIAPLVVAIGNLAAAMTSAFGPVLGTVFSTLSAIASVLSTVLTPVINTLANSSLAPFVGGLLAAVTAMALFSTAIGIVGLKTGELGPKATIAATQFKAAFASVGAVTAGVSTAITASVSAISAAGGKIASGIGAGVASANARLATLGPTAQGAAIRLVQAGQLAGNAFNAIGTGVSRAAGLVQTGFRAMSAASLTSVSQMSSAAAANAAAQARMAAAISATAGATRSQQAGALAASAALRVQQVALTGVAAASGAAAVGARAVGVAFRFMGGPITLVLIGIELIIAGFKGLVEIGKGVGKILEGIFTLDFDKIKEGFHQVVQGAKDTVSQVVDHFTGGGEEAGEGFNDGVEKGAAGTGAALKGEFEKIRFDAAAAGSASGQSFSQQFAQQLSSLNPGAQIATLEALFKEGGLLAGNGFVQGVAERNVVADIATSLQLPQEVIDNFRASGDAGGSGLSEAFQAKIADLKNIIPKSLGEAEALKKLGQQIGGEGGAALVKSAEEAITKLKGGPQKAAGDALKPAGGEAAKQGQEAAKELIDSVTEALQGSADQITASLSLAFDEALGTLGGEILGPKLANALSTGFKFMIASSAGLSSQVTASLSLAFDSAFATLGTGVLGPKLAQAFTTGFQFMIANSGGLSNQVVASLSLAFDGAFAILPGILGVKISAMLSVAFATSIATSTGTLTPQIVASLSLAFDGAFAILPAILGPKISLMLGTMFATVVIDGLPLAGSLTRVFTGAFGLAFISLPAVIAPGLSNALNQGANQALQTFGTGLQGSINQAFITAFSGVGEAINGPLSAAFLGAVGAASTFATTMGSTMETAASNIDGALAPLATTIPQPFSDGFGEAVRVTGLQLDSLVNSVKTAKSQIDAIDFYASGYAIGSRLAAGIRAATAAEVIPAADAMAQAVRDRTPSSPAKKGPLSGSGDPLKTGAKIVQRLIDGIRSEEPQLAALADKLMAEFKDRNFRVDLAGATARNIRNNSGFQTSFSPQGGIINGQGLVGNFNKNVGGSILKQDTDAQISQGTSKSVLQIRPGNVFVTVPGTDDPRKFINDLSKELMTNCVGR